MNTLQLDFIRNYTCESFQNDLPGFDWLTERCRADLEAIQEVLTIEIEKGIVKDPEKSKSELKYISFLLNTPNNKAEMKFKEAIEKKGFKVYFINSFTDEIKNRLTRVFIIHGREWKPIKDLCIIISNDDYANYSIEDLSFNSDYSKYSYQSYI